MRASTKNQPVALAALAACAMFAGCSGKGATSSSSPAPSFSAGQPPRAAQPSHTVGGFSIQLPSTTLQPGDEMQPCYVFPLVVDGASRIVGGGSLTVGPGMHHGNITTRPKTGEGFRVCDDANDPQIVGGEGFDVLNGGSVLFGSSTQREGTEWQSFPDGHGFRIKDGFEIVARMHYLNVTSSPLTVAPTYTWYTIDPSTVVHEIAPFIWTIRDFHIPPLSTKTLTASCDLPPGMHVVSVLPHMHKLGTALTAGFLGGGWDGQQFFEIEGLRSGERRDSRIRSADRSLAGGRRDVRVHVEQHARQDDHRGGRRQRDVHALRLRVAPVGELHGGHERSRRMRLHAAAELSPGSARGVRVILHPPT